jgi:hypothetical protein
VAELIVGEAECRRRAASVKPVSGERADQRLLLETHDARKESPGATGSSAGRGRAGIVACAAGRCGEANAWNTMSSIGISGRGPAIEAALDMFLRSRTLAGQRCAVSRSSAASWALIAGQDGTAHLVPVGDGPSVDID